LDIEGHVRHGLRAVDEDGHLLGVRHPDDVLDRVDGAQRVGDVADGDQPRLGPEQASRTP